MITTTPSAQTALPAERPVHRTPRIVRSGLVAGAVALVSVEAYAAVARAAGVDFKAGFPGAHAAQAITPASFATGILIATLWGTIIAAAIARYARRPVRTFTRVALGATAISLVTPLDATGASVSTKLTLIGAHLLAAGVMTLIVRRGIACS
jgi:hypothetical protein